MRSTLHNVQLLRAAAALMVVFVHLSPLLDRLGVRPPNGGVDLFFVISGFIMVEAARDMLPGEFLARRAARIVPLYWALTLFTFAVALAAPTLFRNTSADPASLAMSLLFIPFTKGGAAIPQPILFVGWTLNYEMFFYLLFACGLMLRRLWLVFAPLIALAAIGIILRPQGIIAAFYTSPLLLEFAFGMAVALVARRWPLPARTAAVLVLIALPLALYADALAPGLDRVITLGVPAAFLLSGAVALDRHGYSLPHLSPLGDASYAIYLIHPFITSAAVGAAGLLPATIAVTVALIASAVALICLAGRVIYAGFERPITRALRPAVRNPRKVAQLVHVQPTSA